MSVKTRLTAEDVLLMPDAPGKRFELVRGELVEMPGATALHGAIAAKFYEVVSAFVHRRGLGRVFPDGVGYIVARELDIVRVPDVSFVSRDRLPEAGIPDSFWPFAPDLAVEVVSANDRAMDIHEKVREYLDGGARMVWVAWPRTRSVTAYAANGSIVEYGPDEDLVGGDVLPGLRVRVATLFAVND